jgi:hypothetical protein
MPARIAGLLTVRPTLVEATSPPQETPTRAGLPRGRTAVSPTIARTAAIPTLTMQIAGTTRTAQRRQPGTPRRVHRTARAEVGSHVPAMRRIKMRLASKTTSHRGAAASLVAEATGRKSSRNSRRVCCCSSQLPVALIRRVMPKSGLIVRGMGLCCARAQFRQLMCKQRIIRKFRRQLCELLPSHTRLFLSQFRQGQHELRKRP